MRDYKMSLNTYRCNRFFLRKMLGTRVMMSQAVGKSGARETQRVTRISARVEKNPRFFFVFF